MLRKVFSLFIGIALLQWLLAACCTEPNVIQHRITNAQLVACNNQTELLDSATVSREDFRLQLTLGEESFAQRFRPSEFISSTYATTCKDEFAGLQTDISKFYITCNEEVLETPPLQAIDNNKFSMYSYNYGAGSPNDPISIIEWIYIMNNGGYEMTFDWYLKANEAIVSSEFLSFAVKIELADSTFFIAGSEPIQVK